MLDFTARTYSFFAFDGLVLAWLFSSIWSAIKKNENSFANSGIFLVLLLLFGVADRQAQIGSFSAKVFENNARNTEQKLLLYALDSKNLAILASLDSFEAGLDVIDMQTENLETLLGSASDKLSATEMQTIVDSQKKVAATKLVLESRVSGVRSVLDAQTLEQKRLLENIKLIDRELVLIKDNLAEISNKWSSFSLWVSVLGALQMTFGSHLVGRKKRSA